MKPIHKFNGGLGATLCHICSVIISIGLTEDLYCEKCKCKDCLQSLEDCTCIEDTLDMKEEQKQHLIDIMKEDERLGLYEQTKCYCGHTTYCDCGPEETVEEYYLPLIKNMLEYTNDALAIRFMEKYYHAKKEQDEKH